MAFGGGDGLFVSRCALRFESAKSIASVLGGDWVADKAAVGDTPCS